MYSWDGSENLSGQVIKDSFEVRTGVTSLIGCPRVVTGDFDCSFNNNITTLEGGPEKVGGKFKSFRCSNLISLKGAPKEVGGRFYCSDTPITTLEGVPQKLGDGIDCSYCRNLVSLKGLQEVIKVGDVIANGCKLKNLEGSPKYIGGRLDIRGNEELISLKGITKDVGMIELSDCINLKVIDDFPENVEYYVDFRGTPIEDIKLRAVINFMKNIDKVKGLNPDVIKKAKRLFSIFKSIKSKDKEEEIVEKIMSEVKRIDKIFFQ